MVPYRDVSGVQWREGAAQQGGSRGEAVTFPPVHPTDQVQQEVGPSRESRSWNLWGVPPKHKQGQKNRQFTGSAANNWHKRKMKLKFLARTSYLLNIRLWSCLSPALYHLSITGLGAFFCFMSQPSAHVHINCLQIMHSYAILFMAVQSPLGKAA